MEGESQGLSRQPGGPLDLRRLRQFVVLAECGNVTRAALLLNTAQPALSVTIRRLEDELGARLFVREARGVRLTPSGEVMLEEARRLLLHAEHVIDTVRAVDLGTGGSLRIGFVASATFGLLQRLVPTFRAAFPMVRPTLLEARNSSEVIGWREERRIDLGIVRTPLSAACSMQLMELETDRLGVALPVGHPLAVAGPISLADLRDAPFIVYRQADAPGLRSAVMLACQHSGFEPHIAQEAVQITTMLALVGSGLGVALIPWATRSVAGSDVVCRPLHAPPEAARTGLSLLYDERGEPAAARAFRRLC